MTVPSGTVLMMARNGNQVRTEPSGRPSRSLDTRIRGGVAPTGSLLSEANMTADHNTPLAQIVGPRRSLQAVGNYFEPVGI